MKIIVRPRSGEDKDTAMARVTKEHPNDELVWHADAKPGDPPKDGAKRKKHRRKGRRSSPSDSPDPRNGGNPGNRSSGGPYRSDLNRKQYPYAYKVAKAESTKLTFVDGQTLTTAVTYPSTRTNMMEAVVHEYALFDVGTLCGDATSDKRPAEVKAINNRFQDYPRLLLGALAARGEAFTTQVFPAGDSSFSDYLNDWSYAYSILRTILAAAVSAYINESMRVISDAMGASGIMRRARNLWIRLEEFPIPLGWPEMINELTGVIDPGDNDFVFICYPNEKSNAASITDWTDPKQVLNLIDIAEDHIRALTARNSLSQFVIELMARAYREFRPFMEPSPIQSKACWDLHFLGMVHLNEDLTGNYVTVPNLTPSGQTVNGVRVADSVIPILTRSKVEKHPFLLTMLRPAFYEGNITAGGAGLDTDHCMVGLLTTRNKNSTSDRIYSNVQNTGLNNTVQNDALTGPQLAIGAFNSVGRVGTSMWSTRWWKDIAYSSLAGSIIPDWLSDTRSYSQWEYYEASPGMLSNPTMRELDRMVLGGIK